MNFTLDNTSTSSNITSVLTCLVFFIIGEVIMCVFIIPFNIWSLFLSTRKLIMNGRSASSDILTLNLFYSCIIVCFVYILYFMNTIHLLLFLSSVAFFFDFVSTVAQAQFHSWICIEHCLAVVFPIFFLKLKKYRYKLVWVSFTWISSLLLAVIIASLNFNVPEWLYSVPYSLMLLVILICNLATLAALRQPSPGNGERREMHLLKLKAFKIISLILVVLVIGYFPYICASLLEKRIPDEELCIARVISFILFLPICVIHSFLYLSKLNMIPCTSLI